MKKLTIDLLGFFVGLIGSVCIAYFITKKFGIVGLGILIGFGVFSLSLGIKSVSEKIIEYIKKIFLCHDSTVYESHQEIKIMIENIKNDLKSMQADISNIRKHVNEDEKY